VLFAFGPSITPGLSMTDARDVDIAPTVLALLGVAPPDGLDGRPIPELTKDVAAAIA
jgi:arylsulfatase A-like enzyme